jgi:iron complex transport system permease protein
MMKVTLDLDQLLADGKITRAEYEKLGALAAKSTGSLAFNILIGFGVIAVSGAALALLPAPATAIVIGLCVLVSGLLILRSGSEQWRVLANICVLVGALMTGGGMVAAAKGSLASILSVAASIFIPSGSRTWAPHPGPCSSPGCLRSVSPQGCEALTPE